MPKSTYLRNAMLNAVLRGIVYVSPATLYLALYSGNPDTNGVEIVGGSYARIPITFSVVASGVTSNSSIYSFTNMPTIVTPVTYIAIYDDFTAGHIVYYAPVTTPITTNVGDTINGAIGTIVIMEN